MIYEDLLAGKSAEQFTERLLHEFDADCDCIKDIWNFEMLSIPEMASFAAMAAANADIVIISTTDEKRLPEVVRQWIVQWISSVDNNSVALVMLSAGTQDDPHPAAHFAECDRDVQYLLQEVFAA